MKCRYCGKPCDKSGVCDECYKKETEDRKGVKTKEYKVYKFEPDMYVFVKAKSRAEAQAKAIKQNKWKELYSNGVTYEVNELQEKFAD